MTARRGSVLIMALWIIAILSVMVVSFAFEARQQAGIDVYVRERNRVSRLIESGRVLGEVVLLDYQNAKKPETTNGEPDWKELFEEDRWCIEKWALKDSRTCQIGPITLDEEKDDDEQRDVDVQTVMVELKFESAEHGIDINCLYDGSKDGGETSGKKGSGASEASCDKEYVDMWRIILRTSGIDEELEVEVEDADRSGHKRHNLMNLLIASWQDWRDSNDDVSRGPLDDSGSDYRHNPQEDDGAERKWYKDRNEEDEIFDSQREIKNGPIAKLEELSYIRGFRDFPAILTGGHLYDGTDLAKKFEKDDEANPMVSGIMDYFKLSGGPKIELNGSTRRKDLLVHLALFSDDLDDASQRGDNEALADAILGALFKEPEDADDRISQKDESGGSWWPYKDIEDLRTRVDDFGCDVDIPNELGERIKFSSDASAKDTTGEKFSMVITCESMGMKYVVKARCVLTDKKVRYIEWSENESKK